MFFLSTWAEAQEQNAPSPFLGVQDSHAAPHNKVTLGQIRSMCCKTVRRTVELDTLCIKAVRYWLAEPSGQEIQHGHIHMHPQEGEVCLSEDKSSPPSKRFAAWKVVGISYWTKLSVSPSAFVRYYSCSASIFSRPTQHCSTCIYACVIYLSS